jgi:tRNA pseudouridine55 synthase
MASAVKREGRRLYDLHRQGITVEREPRVVEISHFTLTDYDAAHESATFSVRCSSGTYVRSLISDLAAAVGSAAYLTALRRTSVGHLAVEDAPILDDLTEETLNLHIIPTTQVALQLPVLEASEDEARAVRHGVAIRGRGFEGSFGVLYGGELLGVYREDDDGDVARPEVVLWG